MGRQFVQRRGSFFPHRYVVTSLLLYFVTAHFCAAQLRRAATDRYPLRSQFIIPGIAASQTSGRAHQISRARATPASAPPYWRPSASSTRISRSDSACDRPSSAPTRASCNGATASPRLCTIGASHRATRVQNPHCASKNSQPRACRPFPSVNSDANEIIVLFLIAEGQPALFSTLAWPSAVWQAAANKQVAAEAVTPTCF